jgi:hypothetical protein
VWRLQIYDAFYADTGYLQKFQLIVTVPDPPLAEVCGAINVGRTNATLCGRVIDDAGEACQYRFRYWNPRDSTGGPTPWTGWVTAGECFSQDVYDLKPGSKYYLFADIRNSTGEYSSIGKSFATMAELVQLGCPNGSVTLPAGSTFPIWWRADRQVGDVLIEYSMDNAVTWNIIDTVANTLEECSCPCEYAGPYKWYYWIVPDGDSQQCLVQVGDANDPSVFDVSDNAFTITPCSVPNVVGLAKADAESAITAAGLVVGAVTLQYHATVPAGNVISQNPAAGTAVVVGSIVNLVISGGPLAASPPKASLEAVCNVGKSSATLKGVIDDDGGGSCQYAFYYGTGGGGHVTDWSFDFKNTGESFSVDVTGLTPGTKYYFFAWAQNSAGQGSTVGWSFTTLTDLLQLEIPKAGHTLIAGSKRVISWKADPIVSEVLIEYSTDNGGSWNTIDTVVNTLLYGGYLGGWYVWDVPPANSTECLMRISDTGDPSIFDMTAGTFSIVP